jgi:hypothetical protein
MTDTYEGVPIRRIPEVPRPERHNQVKPKPAAFGPTPRKHTLGAGNRRDRKVTRAKDRQDWRGKRKRRIGSK